MTLCMTWWTSYLGVCEQQTWTYQLLHFVWNYVSTGWFFPTVYRYIIHLQWSRAGLGGNKVRILSTGTLWIATKGTLIHSPASYYTAARNSQRKPSQMRAHRPKEVSGPGTECSAFMSRRLFLKSVKCSPWTKTGIQSRGLTRIIYGLISCCVTKPLNNFWTFLLSFWVIDPQFHFEFVVWILGYSESSLKAPLVKAL